MATPPTNASAWASMNASHINNGTEYRFYVVQCLFPISGAYTRCQRILSVVVLLVVLCFRLHPWLTTGGIVYLAGTSTMAAVHRVLLSWDPDVAYDADFLVLGVIMQLTALYSVLGVLFWHPHFESGPQYIYTCYFALFMSAVICTGLNTGRWATGFLQMGVVSWCDSSGICAPACEDQQAETLFRRPPSDQLAPFYMGLINTLMLDNATVATAKATDLTAELLSVVPKVTNRSSMWKGAVEAIVLLLMSTTSQFILAVTSVDEIRADIFISFLTRRVVRRGRYSPLRVRALTFVLWMHEVLRVSLFLAWPLWFLIIPFRRGVQFLWQRGWIDFQRLDDFSCLEVRFGEFRYFVARAAGMAWDIWAHACVVALPLWMLQRYLQSEIVLTAIPESESIWAVGQWSPWLTFGLALAVTVANHVSAVVEDEQQRSRVFVHAPPNEAHAPHGATTGHGTPPMTRVWRQLAEPFVVHPRRFVGWCKHQIQWWNNAPYLSFKELLANARDDAPLSSIAAAWGRLRDPRTTHLAHLSRHVYVSLSPTETVYATSATENDTIDAHELDRRFLEQARLNRDWDGWELQ